MSNPFKPDWKDAPDWARYLGMDTNGWRWYEIEPVKCDCDWMPTDCAAFQRAYVEPYIEQKPQEYALYKGEELLAVGTIAEIAEQMGVNEKSIAFYLTDSYQKRLARRKRSKNTRVLEPIDFDDDLEED